MPGSPKACQKCASSGWRRVRIEAVKDTPAHLKVLEEIEREGIPGLVKVFREEGIDAIRYVLWDATGRHPTT